MTRKQLRRILDKMTRVSITGCDTLRKCYILYMMSVFIN